MKKMLCNMLVILMGCIHAMAQDEYSSAVTFVSSTDNILTVSSKGLSERKRDAEAMAVKSAFYTLFYRGIDGYNSGKPLLIKDNDYYMNNFMANRYPMFVSQSLMRGNVEKTTTGKYSCTMEVSILINSLVKDLVLEGLAVKPSSETTMEETDEAISLPTIIVVPYKTEEDTYQSIIQKDRDKRSAIVRVQENFVKQGVTTIDLEGQLNAIYSSKEFNMKTASSAEKNVITRSGADVYVVVDLQQRGSSDGGVHVNVEMKAYDTKTGGILASTSSGWTNSTSNVDLGDVCAIAIKARMNDFMKDLATNMANQIQKGKTVALRIFQRKGGEWGLDSSVGEEGYTLSSIIRRWVKKNAENGRYHLKGGVNEMLWFDTVFIPATDSDGFPMDGATWGDNLLYHLNNDLHVPCKMKFDGTSIDITLQ